MNKRGNLFQSDSLEVSEKKGRWGQRGGKCPFPRKAVKPLGRG